MTSHPAAREFDNIARHWYARTDAVEEAHFERCARFRNWHLWLGGVSVACTTFLWIFANAHEAVADFPVIKSYCGPMLTVLAPVLAGLVAFLRLDEKSTLHHNAAAGFAELKRWLDIIIVECAGEIDHEKLKREINTICEKWNALTLQSPTLYRKEAKKYIKLFKKVNQSWINIISVLTMLCVLLVKLPSLTIRQ
jgi:hypothetical protein